VCLQDPERVVAEALRERPNRLAHTRGVVRKIGRLIRRFPRLGRTLLLAAWYHDIGYSPLIEQTGFHPVDGAIFLSACGLPRRVVHTVLWHGQARAMAPARCRRFYGKPPACGAWIDAVTYCDVTVDSRGRNCTVQKRLHDIIARRGPHSQAARHFRRFFEEYSGLVQRFD
jgi:hypothetical protein